MTTPADASSTPRPPAARRAATTVAAATGLTLPSLPAIPTGAAPRGSGGRPAPEPPLHSLLLPCKSGAVFLRHGRTPVLPMFTGREAAEAFLVRARMTRCWMIELPTADAVVDFLRSVPGRPGQPADFVVAVDPADLMRLATVTFTAAGLIAALEGGRS